MGTPTSPALAGLATPAAPADARPSRVRYYVLAWLCVASLIAYMDRGCIAVAKDSIQKDLALSPEHMGDLLAAFFLTYGFLQIPAAALAQRWGTRRALAVFAAVWSETTGLCGLATGYGQLLVYRLGMGAAEAGIFPCATTALGRWFPSTRRAWVCGMLTAFMGVGGVLGGVISGYLVAYLSWRWMFLLYTIPGVLWALGFYWWFRDRPREHRGVNAAELAVIEEGPAAGRPASPAGPVPWGIILSSGALWLLGFQQFFRSLGLAFFQSYYPSFLEHARGASVVEAGNYTGTAFGALVFGSLVGGMLADWILVRTGSRSLSRKGLGLVSTISGAAAVAAALSVDSLWLTGLLVAGAALLVSLSNSCGYALTIDMGGKYVPAVFAVVNSLANFGYVFFPKLITPREDWTRQDWDSVLILVMSAFLGAALCWVFFNPYARITGEAEEA